MNLFSRLIPYPLLALGLAAIWLLLSGLSVGQAILAVVVGIGASHTLVALGEVRPRIGNWRAMAKLTGIVALDIVRSNLGVARILVTGRRPQSGFVTIPLRIRNPSALALLSIIITNTPGTAWLDYSAARNEVLLHVFDLSDGTDWKALVAERYESLLLEIYR